ncbi:ABC transporter substrate-binding protein [Starkeya sp. ORNL1]|uniref:molybdate ABC transporter substrate-binding protein n=1 Tax=Starkeya sp. ORNL1 TaxID=2709380 RepID=UPI00146289CC|nr:substrate-binding domain-containing protein [Starkeya sp. ORNL1]QJP13959.1 ABC transporter substrate-binding protein [Starkeya sp. ORNL1]
MSEIRIFCAGAAKGLVEILASRFEQETGHTTSRSYGPVGAILERLKAGEAADIVILSEKALAGLAQAGTTTPTIAPLGDVATCVAVRAGDPSPPLASAEDLRHLFSSADAIHMPNPAVATSGAHLMGVFRALGLAEETAERLRIAGNGIAAITELAASTAERPVGCTQASEILVVEGARIVGPLPGEFALATLYAAAVTTAASDPAAAALFISLLTGEETAPLRARMGFQAT